MILNIFSILENLHFVWNVSSSGVWIAKLNFQNYSFSVFCNKSSFCSLMKIGRIWEASARRLDRIDQFSFLSHRAVVIALMDLLWPNFNKKWTLLGRRCSSCQPFPFLWPRIEILQGLDRYIAALTFRQNIFLNILRMIQISTRSSWLNCGLRVDELRVGAQS